MIFRYQWLKQQLQEAQQWKSLLLNGMKNGRRRRKTTELHTKSYYEKIIVF